MDSEKLQQKIEQEEQWLRSTVIPEIIKSKKLKNPNDAEISVGRIEIKFIGIEEAFMLTNCYRASVEFVLNNNTHQRSLVVKKTPQLPPEIYEGINFGALFSNEVIAYKTIAPAIEDFIGKAFKLPKYYYSDWQKYAACMVLEDFGVDGWRVAKDKFNLSLEHILTAVNYLGEFHGIGFAMRALKREQFDAITANLKEPRYDTKPAADWMLTVDVSLQRLFKATRDLEPSVSEEFLQKLEKILRAEMPYGKQRLKPREPLVTLCHGDFLRNNIAFQYDKDAAKKATKAMMFDLQTIQVSSPMMDLVILLLVSAFTQVRHRNFQQIFNNYCVALHKSYEMYAKQKAPEYLSHEALLREFILFMPYGLQIGAFFIPMIMEPEDISSEELLQSQQTVEEITEMAMNRGGEIFNKEIAHQVKELFDLSLEYDVDIGKDIQF